MRKINDSTAQPEPASTVNRSTSIRRHRNAMRVSVGLQAAATPGRRSLLAKQREQQRHRLQAAGFPFADDADLLVI